MTGPMTGRVLSVETRNVAEPTTASAAIGATILYVNDASTFNETGGLVTILGELVDYTAANVDDDSLTLAVPLTVALEEQELVELYPPTPVKTALVSLDDNGDNLEVTVPHSLLDKLVDGTRDESTAESVTLEPRGAYEWLIADAPAKPLEQVSTDYVEGEQGYGLTESGVQVRDLQATGDIGAATVAADEMLLAGEDLGELLDQIPGATKWASRGNTSATQWAGNTSGTTELRCFVFDAGELKAGIAYRVSAIGLMSGTVDNDVFWTRLRYTEDGSDPTTASPALRAALCGPILGGRGDIEITTIYTPATNVTLRLAVTIARRTGTGTGAIITSGADTAFQITASPLGLSADSSTALQQTAKADGTGSDNPPETTKTLWWQSTHHEDFSGVAGVNGGASFSDQGYAEIGWDTNFWGAPQTSDRPNYSILHFNYADIVAKLASASSIVSVQLKFRVRTRAAASGLDMTVFAHKYTSFPWTMAQDMNGEIAAGRIILNQGSRNDSAPGIDYTINLLTAVGTNLKSGLYKGIGLHTNVFSTAGLGSIYANPSSVRPTLIIKFKSPA